jgi:nucleoside-diphosphate-sugar epimerase
MTIFATGVRGTIGRHLSNEVEPLLCDLQNPHEIDAIGKFSEHARLIHLAGVVGATNVENNPQTSWEINVLGTIRLANKFLENGGRNFIYVSSSHVYSSSKTKLQEESELGPTSRYAEQKLETEFKLLDLFKDSNANLCIVRVFSVLDWDVQPFTLGGAIKKLADTRLNTELKYSDDVRDFLTPRKIAESLQSLAHVSNMPKILNLCSGEGLSVANAAISMLSESGFEVPMRRILSGQSENPHIVGNNARIREVLPNLDLNWEPSQFKSITKDNLISIDSETLSHH